MKKKWRNIVKNCEAYNSFISLGSDHRIVNVKIKVSFKAQKRKKTMPNYNWYILKTNNEIQVKCICYNEQKGCK